MKPPCFWLVVFVIFQGLMFLYPLWPCGCTFLLGVLAFLSYIISIFVWATSLVGRLSRKEGLRLDILPPAVLVGFYFIWGPAAWFLHQISFEFNKPKMLAYIQSAPIASDIFVENVPPPLDYNIELINLTKGKNGHIRVVFLYGFNSAVHHNGWIYDSDNICNEANGEKRIEKYWVDFDR